MSNVDKNDYEVELEVMKIIAFKLLELDADARERVITWFSLYLEIKD